MRRAVTIMIVGVALAACPVSADYTVANRGTWPESWPKELDSLRSQARTYEGPLRPLLHHGITFTTRAEFEAAWPHLLKVKSKGAPIILRRGSNFWLDGAALGVCIHTPPAGTKPLESPELKPSRLHTTNYLELVVDGKIIDLNRISLPRDTPIIDERFKDAESDAKRTR